MAAGQVEHGHLPATVRDKAHLTKIPIHLHTFDSANVGSIEPSGQAQRKRGLSPIISGQFHVRLRVWSRVICSSVYRFFFIRRPLRGQVYGKSLTQVAILFAEKVTGTLNY